MERKELLSLVLKRTILSPESINHIESIMDQKIDRIAYLNKVTEFVNSNFYKIGITTRCLNSYLDYLDDKVLLDEHILSTKSKIGYFLKDHDLIISLIALSSFVEAVSVT